MEVGSDRLGAPVKGTLRSGDTSNFLSSSLISALRARTASLGNLPGRDKEAAFGLGTVCKLMAGVRRVASCEGV